VAPEAGTEPDATRATGVPANIVPSVPTNVNLFNFHFLPFFINFHKEWGKTTTKTDVVAPAARRVPVAIRAFYDPVNVVPSAPTKL